MTSLSHVLMGLIIGKITGNYPVAIVVSLAVDVDHFISFYRHGALFNFKRLLKEALGKDPWGDQRNILHNVFVFIILSFLVMIFNPVIALTFFLAYFFHLLLDIISKSPLYPLYPSKKFAINGLMKYSSKQEFLFGICLISILMLSFIIKT